MMLHIQKAGSLESSMPCQASVCESLILSFQIHLDKCPYCACRENLVKIGWVQIVLRQGLVGNLQDPNWLS